MAGKKQRNRWSEAFRRRIVAEAEAFDGPMSEVAERHGLHPKRLYSWRQQFMKERETVAAARPSSDGEVCLLPVEVKAVQDEPLAEVSPVAGSLATLEIILPCGSRLMCSAGMEPGLLREALVALRPTRLDDGK